MVGGEIGLVYLKAAQPVHRAVGSQHGHGQQHRTLRGTGQGQQTCRPAAAVNGRRCRIQMPGKLGKLGQLKFLRPLPVRHHAVTAPDVRHAAVEQQIAGNARRIAPLNVQAAAELLAAEGGVEHHERAGAVRLPDVLTQRLEHGLLQPLHCVRAAVESGKLRGLPLHDGAHVLGQMHSHDGDIAPHRLHVRLKGLHAEAQRGAQLLLRAFELIKEEQPGDKRRRQNKAQRDHIDRKALFHGAPYIIKFRKCVSRHAPYPPGNVFICRSSTAAPMSPRPERRHPRRLRRGRAAPAAAAAERRTGR